MRNILSLALVATLCLGLAACGKPDRKTADKKLLKACELAIKSLYQPEDTFDIKEKNFSNDKSHEGVELRKVHFMAYYVQNGGAIQEKHYYCWFEETIGFMGYLPKFYRLDRDGEKYGNYDGEIMGDYSELLKLQQVVEDALK